MGISSNRLFVAALEARTEVSKDTFECTFRVEEGTSFSFEPGQYVWIDVGDRAKGDTKGSRRAYSLLSVPRELPLFSIVFRASASLHKKALVKLSIGEEISVTGPFGSSFCLPGDKNTPIIGLSGGVGIAPFLSLARYIKQTKSEDRIHLLMENDKKQRVCYEDEVLSLGGRSIVGGISWDDIRAIPGLERALFYISGPVGMVDRLFDLLSAQGVPMSRMRFEAAYPTPKGHVALSLVDFQIGSSESGVYKGNPNEVFRIAIEGTSQHLIITDTNGTIVYANKAAERITGFTQGELLGNTPRLWGGLMSKEFYKKLWETKEKGEAAIGEMINRRKDGSLYTALFHITPIFNHERTMIGYVATEEDISDRVEIENRRRETERFLKAVVDNIPNVIFVKNASDFKYVFINKAGERLLGVSDEEIKGKRDEDLFPGKTLGLSNKDSVAGHAKLSNTEEEFETKTEGRRFLATKNVPLLDDQNVVVSVLGISEDVTERRNAEREREQTMEELRNINKNLVGRELKMIELKEEIDRLKKDEHEA